MAIEGVDYSWARPAPSELYRLGKRFGVRYLSWGSSGRGSSVLSGASNGKVLTKAEADKLQAAGLSVVSNWEFRTDDQMRGRDGGRYDAREADRIHKACGGPDGAVIYFSTDFDASTSQLATCYEYLRGCADVLGWDRVGVYGGYKTIAFMHAKGVKWLWQTYAWSGGRWHPAAQLQQYRNGVKVAGSDVDLNRATQTHYGQWNAAPKPSVPSTPSKPSTDWTQELIMSLPTLRRGSDGSAVKRLQGLLHAAGQRDSAIDGDFGSGTERAVRDFQRTKKIGVDGIVGRNTWTRLIKG